MMCILKLSPSRTSSRLREPASHDLHPVSCLAWHGYYVLKTSSSISRVRTSDVLWDENAFWDVNGVLLATYHVQYGLCVKLLRLCKPLKNTGICPVQPAGAWFSGLCALVLPVQKHSRKEKRKTAQAVKTHVFGALPTSIKENRIPRAEAPCTSFCSGLCSSALIRTTCVPPAMTGH
eukprot:709548-Pelagomonas_calceolata.AAC.1